MLQQIYTPQQTHNTNIKTLQKTIKTIKKPFTIKTKPQLWAAFTYHTIKERKINTIYTDELAATISKFTTGTPYPKIQDNNIKTKKLEKEIKQKYQENLKKHKNIEAYKKTIEHIINIFTTDKIRNFEIINTPITIYLKQSEASKFKQIKGENNREKLIKLLNNF